MLQTADILNFDPVLGGSPTFPLTNDLFTEIDWAKGPAGTNQDDMMHLISNLEVMRGNLVESWEIPSLDTKVYNIRRGIRYSLDPSSEASRLVAGREVTADDIIFTIKRNTTNPARSVYLAAPEMSRALTVEKTGPWQVTVKTPVDIWKGFERLFYGVGGSVSVQVPEVVQKYGNMNDWRNSVGPGAWMLTDFVPGSAATLKRNPGYWDKNPIGPGKGDQLPYIDTLKLLVIVDISTWTAALRTGRVDWASNVQAEDAKSLRRTAPRLKDIPRTQNYPLAIGFRLDKPNLPFANKKVRQALMMATDLEGIRRDLYGEDAVLVAWPVINAPETKGAYHPLSEMPEAVQTLWKYNPEKAKQLLAEAGYPNGFKAKLVLQNVQTAMDPAAAVKAMWSKVGVDVELQPREQAVFAGIQANRAYDEMFMRGVTPGRSDLIGFDTLYGESLENISYVNDPKVAEAFAEAQKHIVIDWPGLYKRYYDLMPYVMEQAWLVPLPAPITYTFWQPWIKNYLGQNTLSFGGGINWVKFVWVDQDLREQMTGRR